MNQESFISNTPNEKKIFRKIHILHTIASVFFFILTICFSITLKDITVVPSTSFATGSNGPIGFPAQQIYENSSFNPCILIILFVLLAAIDHAIISFLCFFHKDLVKWFLFVKKNNPIRWFEYCISSTLMLLSICILCGISDINIWILLITTNTIAMLFGNVLELLCSPLNSDDNKVIINWVFYLSAGLVFLPWILPLWYFFRGVVEYNKISDSNIPSFVYVALLGTFVCFSTFGINSYLYCVQKKYDFYQAEIFYIILSFVAKFLLSVDVYGGLSSASQ